MDHQLNLSVDWPVLFSMLLGNPVHGKSKWFFVIWNQSCIENDRFNNSEAMFHLKAGWNQEIANLLHPSKSLIIHCVCNPPPHPPSKINVLCTTMQLTYCITKSAYKYRKIDSFYKSCLHGEHKRHNHAKYNSFQMIFLQL